MGAVLVSDRLHDHPDVRRLSGRGEIEALLTWLRGCSWYARFGTGRPVRWWIPADVALECASGRVESIWALVIAGLWQEEQAWLMPPLQPSFGLPLADPKMRELFPGDRIRGYVIQHGADSRRPLWKYQRNEPERAHIPEVIRRAVYQRDGHACVTCGATTNLTLDHIHPWSLGGPDTINNLQTMCRSCNSSKGARV